MLDGLRKMLAYPPDPVWLIEQPKRIESILCELGEGAQVVDIGGRSKRWKDVWALDLHYAPDLDAMGDAACLPLADSSLDGIICTYVLEHVANPERAVQEAWRVLKPGGTYYIETPFLFGCHGRGYSDYTRWTRQGLEHLCHGFQLVEVGVASGSISVIAYVLKESVPMLLTRADSKTYWALRALVGWLVFPLKYLDRFMISHPYSWKIAATLYCKAVK